MLIAVVLYMLVDVVLCHTSDSLAVVLSELMIVHLYIFFRHLLASLLPYGIGFTLLACVCNALYEETIA